MKKAIAIAVLMAAAGSVSAAGLFTKVDTYTLQGIQGIKNDNSSNPVPIPFSIEGFANVTECAGAGDALKAQMFSRLTSQSGGAVVAYANYTCHKVKAIVPVLEVVTTPAP